MKPVWINERKMTMTCVLLWCAMAGRMFAQPAPATTEPATTEPATTEPSTTEPSTTEPATTEPATTEPAAATVETEQPSVATSRMSVADLAEAGEWELLLERLESGEDPDRAQPDGMTALHWAAVGDRATEISALLKSGAPTDPVNAYRVTPLSLACEYGCARAGIVLINSGADVHAERLGKETPLMLAARSGNVDLVQALIHHKAKLDARESAGQTALMWAAAAGNIHALDALIRAGADVSLRLGNSDFSALMFAARQGHTECVLRLLDAGIDINDVMHPKRTGGRDPRKGTSALMLAVESGHLQLAMQLVARGADPNDQRSGFAPLHAITWVRRTELGDNPSGDPPPRITGSLTTEMFVDAIVEAGADVNLRLETGASRGGRLNPRGATPFLLASRGADLQLMKQLLRHGADPAITNQDGTNALMAAAGVGVIAVGEEPGTPEEVNRAIELLVKEGIAINTVDKNGETAMHGAALRTFPSTVTRLSELGADPTIWNRKNRRGWTPFDIARGKRPGSVKPSPPTVRALESAVK